VTQGAASPPPRPRHAEPWSPVPGDRIELSQFIARRLRHRHAGEEMQAAEVGHDARAGLNGRGIKEKAELVVENHHGDRSAGHSRTLDVFPSRTVARPPHLLFQSRAERHKEDASARFVEVAPSG